MTLTIGFGDVEAASRRIAPYVHHTPVVRSSSLDAIFGAELFFKAENLQKIGAFKARGATNAVMSLSDEEAAAGLVTHSSGNHGQAVAFAARSRGVPAWIVMPADASSVKRDAVLGYGAEVVTSGQEDRDEVARAVRSSTGARLVHPFDDPDVIAGQGTAALELDNEVPDLDVVVTPIGGGGLLSGTAVTYSTRSPDTQIIGAEPHNVDDAYRSLTSGVRQAQAPGATSVADGLLGGIGELTFSVLSQIGVTVIRVTEDAILDAGRLFLMRTKLLIEPSAATAIAALATEPERFAGKRVGVILSGGNTDLGWF